MTAIADELDDTLERDWGDCSDECRKQSARKNVRDKTKKIIQMKPCG